MIILEGNFDDTLNLSKHMVAALGRRWTGSSVWQIQ